MEDWLKYGGDRSISRVSFDNIISEANKFSSSHAHKGYIKEYAKTHPRFSRTICARTAKLYRHYEYYAKGVALKAAGRTWFSGPPAPLTEREAREMGGDILGEVIIFLLGALIIIYEVNRQAEKAEAKEAEKKAAWQGLLALLDEIKKQLETQQATIDTLRAVLQETVTELENEEKAKQKNTKNKVAGINKVGKDKQTNTHKISEESSEPKSGEVPARRSCRYSGCDDPCTCK